MTSPITQQWMDSTTTVQLARGAVKMRPYDVTSLLDGDGNALNPLMQDIRGLIDGGKQPMVALRDGFMKNLETMPVLRKMLNDLLRKVIIEPDLNEFDVDRFTMMEKIQLFTELLGGEEAMNQARIFPAAEGTHLETVPNGK